MLSKSFAALSALALVAGSSAAAAQTAQPLSLANSPALAEQQANGEASELSSRGYGIYVIGAIIIALIIWGAIELLDKNEGPVSP